MLSCRSTLRGKGDAVSIPANVSESVTKHSVECSLEELGRLGGCLRSEEEDLSRQKKCHEAHTT